MKSYVQEKVVVITGGSSGFGLETARLLLEMGSKVVVTGRDAKRLRAAEKDLKGGRRLLYTAAKAGLVVYTRCLHLEMAAWGGKATSFVPGAARTNFCKAAKIDDGWLAGYPGGADFARTLVHCIDVPENCFVEEVNLWGTKQVATMLNPF